MPEKRRAVGEIMAALVLMLIVSISGSFMYMISLQTTTAQHQQVAEDFKRDSESAQERFNIIAAGTDESNNFIMILNYGKIDLKINEIYVDGEKANIIAGNDEDIKTLEIKKIVFQSPGAVGNVVEISAVSERGVRSVFVWEK